MGLFTKKATKEVYDYAFEANKYVEKRVLNHRGKVAIGAAALVGIYTLVADEYGDMFGDVGTTRSQEVARGIADDEYRARFAVLNPADKFTMQYGGETMIRVDYTEGDDGLVGGILSSDKDYLATYNSACLANTAYDINGGEFTLETGRVFFYSIASGEVPTAAAFAQVDSENPDMLHIASGNSASIGLTFTGVGGDGPLIPANSDTERILATYGCQSGLTSIELEYDGTLDYHNLTVSVD
jgi:hypothetical protein